jgi:hypothetical protein
MDFILNWITNPEKEKEKKRRKKVSVRILMMLFNKNLLAKDNVHTYDQMMEPVLSHHS